MRDLAKLLADHTLQKRVRESMRHSQPFQSPERLPDHLQRQLDELDRVMGERERQSGRS